VAYDIGRAHAAGTWTHHVARSMLGHLTRKIRTLAPHSICSPSGGATRSTRCHARPMTRPLPCTLTSPADTWGLFLTAQQVPLERKRLSPPATYLRFTGPPRWVIVEPLNQPCGCHGATSRRSLPTMGEPAMLVLGAAKVTPVLIGITLRHTPSPWHHQTKRVFIAPEQLPAKS
jgi:hypothetical protein